MLNAEVVNAGAELQGFGGLLRCTVCGLECPLGDVGTKLTDGWPKHCGYTMRWVTQRQRVMEKAAVMREESVE